MIAFMTIALFFALAVAGIHYEVLLFLDGIFGLGWLTGISMMVNFYRKVYLELRKQKRCQTSQVSFLVKARIERKIAHTDNYCFHCYRAFNGCLYHGPLFTIFS